MIDLYASESHYLAHALPVWDALDDDVRGHAYVIGPAATSAPRHFIRDRPARRDAHPVIVASIQDHNAVAPRPTVFVEHGAGQTYQGDPRARSHPAYSGGRTRERAALFICPNEIVATRNRLMYPSADAIAVGCPKLDPWHRGDRPCGAGTGVVAISFHADIDVCQESRWAFPWYQQQLRETVRCFNVLGHGHPRAWRPLERYWRQLNVNVTGTFADVLDTADVYVVDNSSSGYEFASTGRPVIWLNAPWYRREVSHGMRFWDLVPGEQVDNPADMHEVIERALSGHSHGYESVVDQVYAYRDGAAALRAAKAVYNLIDA